MLTSTSAWLVDLRSACAIHYFLFSFHSFQSIVDPYNDLFQNCCLADWETTRKHTSAIENLAIIITLNEPLIWKKSAELAAQCETNITMVLR